jgi:hypothetical protein
LDADHIRGADGARLDLERAVLKDVADGFEFAITGSEEIREGDLRLAVRYKVESSLAGRVFEPLQVDVSVAPPPTWDAESARRPGLLKGLGLEAFDVPLVPLERHVAEKVHAFTRTYKSGPTTRARDLVDLLLIHEHGRIDRTRLRDAIRRIFDRRATHAIPVQVPIPPRELATSYRRGAERVGMSVTADEAHRILAAWLDPILAEAARQARPAEEREP